MQIFVSNENINLLQKNQQLQQNKLQNTQDFPQFQNKNKQNKDIQNKQKPLNVLQNSNIQEKNNKRDFFLLQSPTNQNLITLKENDVNKLNTQQVNNQQTQNHQQFQQLPQQSQQQILQGEPNSLSTSLSQLNISEQFSQSQIIKNNKSNNQNENEIEDEETTSVEDNNYMRSFKKLSKSLKLQNKSQKLSQNIIINAPPLSFRDVKKKTYNMKSSFGKRQQDKIRKKQIEKILFQKQQEIYKEGYQKYLQQTQQYLKSQENKQKYPNLQQDSK
ncbi:hypothetical protein PPERSA_03528 [Pseudocohnilembus persalinus]|uniref:Uncharacterized protein n=1 Tax=Pseudocohnilembus persalinus TaxID=266149 RepID=A0A0V0Q8I4_PSEPJ|nr:hypothetical protein PPERSA_03528 [Pseudocohnilembus persalinus]|eukprot:KRW98356.1 hypothetical protein PPERSA_03528 [Pseudocohnilembus persalinus]